MEGNLGLVRVVFGELIASTWWKGWKTCRQLSFHSDETDETFQSSEETA